MPNSFKVKVKTVIKIPKTRNWLIQLFKRMDKYNGKKGVKYVFLVFVHSGPELIRMK